MTIKREVDLVDSVDPADLGDSADSRDLVDPGDSVDSGDFVNGILFGEDAVPSGSARSAMEDDATRIERRLVTGVHSPASIEDERREPAGSTSRAVPHDRPSRA